MERAIARSGSRDSVWDWTQQFEWLAREAQQGNESARKAVLEAFPRRHHDLGQSVARPYLDATGREGFEAAWDSIRDGENEFERQEFVRAAIAVLGRAQIERRVGRAFLNRLLRRKERPIAVRARAWSSRDVEATISGAKTARSVPLVAWAKSARRGELERLDERITTERDRTSLLQILRVFSARQLHAGLGRARQLARGRDRQLAHAAVLALVRAGDELALTTARDRLRAASVLRDTRWLPLLASGGDDADARALARRLPSSPGVRLAHDVGVAALEWAKRGVTKELVSLLLWTWDHTPCGHCRTAVLRVLLRTHRAPARVLREASFDAMPTIGALARQRQGRLRRSEGT
ncbi:MAG: hypothetical protein NTV21_10110 [Planctomycetota bacterium]|nr:hypothetical protein [Planctomycetota bacterium]